MGGVEGGGGGHACGSSERWVGWRTHGAHAVLSHAARPSTLVEEPPPPPILAPSSPPQAKSTLDILRSLLVFSTCRIGPLVAHADSVLAWSKRVFGATLTNAVIRRSFYKQFVAGESIEACAATLAAMAAHGVGGITVYGKDDEGRLGGLGRARACLAADPLCSAAAHRPPAAAWLALQARTRSASSPRSCA